jgi:hypothetical protein
VVQRNVELAKHPAQQFIAATRKHVERKKWDDSRDVVPLLALASGARDDGFRK